MTEKQKRKLQDALYKRAVGYTAEDENEEFIYDENGNGKLQKKKVSKRDVSPDLSAIKLLLDTDNCKKEDLTEEELLKERDRLLAILHKKQSK